MPKTAVWGGVLWDLWGSPGGSTAGPLCGAWGTYGV